LTINELHALAKGGDNQAENRLFCSLTESFRLFVQHRIWDEQDAEELVQDTLATIAEKYRGIDFAASFAAWAYKTLENKLLHYYRTKHGRESRFAQMTDDQEHEDFRASDPALKRQLMNCLRRICEANNRYARILNLRYQGYSTEEICERLGITRNNAYILLSRARSMLKLCLEKGDLE